MSSYDGQHLFASGPHRFTTGARRVRASVYEAPAVEGARVVALGGAAKRISQIGRLVAPTLGELDALVSAIHAIMDGRAAELVDDRGTSHLSMVLRQFEPTGVPDVGRMCSLAYTAEYVEAR